MDEAERDAFTQALINRDAEIERLRARTHEIQEREDKRHVDLTKLVAECRRRFDAAKRWTENVGLTAEWAAEPMSPFWSMTSMWSRDVLAQLVAERGEARAQVAAVRSIHRREPDLFPDHSGTCTYCRDADEEPSTWPCDTIAALATAADGGTS